MKEPTQLPTQPQTARPVDNEDEWQRELRRMRARAHANQARQALCEARNKQQNRLN